MAESMRPEGPLAETQLRLGPGPDRQRTVSGPFICLNFSAKTESPYGSGDYFWASQLPAARCAIRLGWPPRCT
jgi:hypothetical protein